MTNFTELNQWESSIRSLDEVDFVLGGEAGPSNIAQQQLANRTTYLKSEVEKRAMIAHSHDQLDVIGLIDALASKALLIHGHAIADIEFLQGLLDSKALLDHEHAISQIVGLQTALDILNEDVGTLQSEIVNKSPLIHSHVINDTTGLQLALDSKSSIGHDHQISEVVNLQLTLNNKSNTGHVHTTGNITGLDTALASKSNVGHTHTTSEITGLDTALASKSNVGHTHTASSLGIGVYTPVTPGPGVATMGYTSMGDTVIATVETIPFTVPEGGNYDPTRVITLPYSFSAIRDVQLTFINRDSQPARCAMSIQLLWWSNTQVCFMINSIATNIHCDSAAAKIQVIGQKQ